ncbi:hypothetical protein HanIR_Chr11g0536561 [Helianthus annuus]|nr:hypothetical protein HanIR_Chr11g0536561 [Helianthus annuus]
MVKRVIITQMVVGNYGCALLGFSPVPRCRTVFARDEKLWPFCKGFYIFFSFLRFLR